ncbi:lysine exporter LysO family protein [Moraxella sp.]|uniref:lysine exporter LysO family protein n=1 Tax=Moraxella sp. TaxID=479 RepID=UPI0026DC121E|nr:lysine exporter LysO family protein [Moraxella sp.]MDO4894483.1 lysine exporter LysO family protein [Moraxella sp.]
MQGLTTLFLILSPMFVGFALPSHHKAVALSERLLGYIVFALLIIIGIELGLEKNFTKELSNIVQYVSVLLLLTIGLGSMSLIAFDKITHRHQQQTARTSPQRQPSLTGSLAQLGCLAGGFILAKILPTHLLPPNGSTTALLMALLLLVGISLKGSGISLRQAILNKQGLQISVIFILSTLFAGVIFASIFGEVSLFKGLALASGFGWYSLSGSIMTDNYGAIWGSVALLNDLGREIIALIFIPVMMRYSASSAIGLGGVTSLDFTLPTIIGAGGTQMMPVVISFGFITNVISPILMVFFSSLG